MKIIKWVLILYLLLSTWMLWFSMHAAYITTTPNIKNNNNNNINSTKQNVHATEKRNLEKFVAFFSFSVIFWFQCTHELEHIQISCLFLFVYRFFFITSILCDLFIIGMYAFLGSARFLQDIARAQLHLSNRILTGYNCCASIRFLSFSDFISVFFSSSIPSRRLSQSLCEKPYSMWITTKKSSFELFLF